MYVSSTQTKRDNDNFNDFIISLRPYWIFENANGKLFAHPPNLFVLDLYKKLYSNQSVGKKSVEHYT